MPVRCLHDFAGNAADLDVHLQSGDARRGSSHFEVHIAQMIFITKDIGEDGKIVAFLDQAHGNAGHRSLEGNAGIHHGHGAAADGSHGRGAVALGNVGDDPDGVRKIFVLGQYLAQSALGQHAVTDLATSRCQPETGFADENGGKL